MNCILTSLTQICICTGLALLFWNIRGGDPQDPHHMHAGCIVLNVRRTASKEANPCPEMQQEMHCCFSTWMRAAGRTRTPCTRAAPCCAASSGPRPSGSTLRPSAQSGSQTLNPWRRRSARRSVWTEMRTARAGRGPVRQSACGLFALALDSTPECRAWHKNGWGTGRVGSAQHHFEHQALSRQSGLCGGGGHKLQVYMKPVLLLRRRVRQQ